MSLLSDIEKLTTAYGSERDVLTGRVQALTRELEEVRSRHLIKIKNSVGKVAERHAALKAALEESPELFVKPKTLVFAGIKVGYKKGTGSLDWEDDDQVVKLIKKHFKEQADILIKTKETPSKDALENLDVADLKKLGVTVGGTGDRVFIKPTDSAVDKVVKALLKEAEDDSDEQREAA